jgi:hypothetical protein
MTYSKQQKNETSVDSRTTCLTLVIRRDRKAERANAALEEFHGLAEVLTAERLG